MQVRTTLRERPTNCGHCSPEWKRAIKRAFHRPVFAHSGVRAQHVACTQRPKKYQSRECVDNQESALKQRFPRAVPFARRAVPGQRHDVWNVSRSEEVSLW